MGSARGLGSQVIAVQEHAAHTASHASIRASLSRLGYNSCLAGCDPEASSNIGGVGVLIKQPIGH
eukprot:14745685-Alexandrium_andersonii.AAC.1